MKKAVKGLLTLSMLVGSGFVMATDGSVHPSNSGTQMDSAANGARSSAGQNDMNPKRTDGALRDTRDDSGKVVTSKMPNEGTNQRIGSYGSDNPEMGNANFTSQTNIRKVQEALIERGHEAGATDGILGSRTKTALRAFQKDNDLSETGRLNRETLKELGVNIQMDSSSQDSSTYSE